MTLTSVIFLLLLSYSHTCDQDQPVDINDVNTQKLLTSMHNFAFQLIRKLIYNPQISTNLVISPMSIYVSLALVLFGSAGDTRTELIAALGFPDADFQVLEKSFRDILSLNEVFRSEMINSQQVIYVQAHIAEGLFIQQGFSVVDAYGSFLKCSNIVPQFVDFVNNMPDASNRITQWIMDNNPKSDSMAVSSLPAQGTMAFITSLFYFTATWKGNLFSESNTGPATFYSLNNIQGEVAMMKALTSLPYYDDGRSFTAVEIPYTGEEFTAIFALPYATQDAVEFATNFSVDRFDEFLRNARRAAVDCQIPKFSSTYSLGLKEALTALGITRLFDGADLSGMLVTNGQKFVAEVTHNAKMSVDEKGTSAVALTTVALLGSGAPPTNYYSFVAERPFLMLVRNVRTNAIAFATFFYKPTA